MVSDYNVTCDTQAQGLEGAPKGDKRTQPGKKDRYVGYMVTPSSLSHSSLLINEDMVRHECLSYRPFRFLLHSQFKILRTKTKQNQTRLSLEPEKGLDTSSVSNCFPLREQNNAT